MLKNEAPFNPDIALALMREANEKLRPLIQQYGRYLDPATFKQISEQFEDGLISGCEAILKIESLLNPCPE